MLSGKRRTVGCLAVYGWALFPYAKYHDYVYQSSRGEHQDHTAYLVFFFPLIFCAIVLTTPRLTQQFFLRNKFANMISISDRISPRTLAEKKRIMLSIPKSMLN